MKIKPWSRFSATNALGTTQQAVERYGFDEVGNMVWSVDANGAGVTNTFDAANRLVHVDYANGTWTGTLYDALGRRVAETNQNGEVTGFAYNAAGQLACVTNAVQEVARYYYDAAGSLIEQVDALNRTNWFFYDELGRRISRRVPEGQQEWFGYDLVGNLVRHTNFNGLVITNEFDLMNRLTNVSTITGQYVRTTYTPTGQRATVDNPEALVTFTYDSRDRLATKTVEWKTGRTITLSYTRDANGNVTNLWSDTPNGINLVYDYDPLNRLKTVHASGQLAAEYGFDLNGNLQSIHLGNGVTNLCQHDLLNRLTNMVWKSGATPLASFHYQLGPTGNRTNLAETLNGTGRNYAWTYDALYRLRGEIISGLGTVSYGLDSVGNRNSRTSSISVLPNQSFGYSANDWLTSDTYDSNGNTTGSGGNTFGYNTFNRLTNFGNVVYFGYDGDGNRITRTADGTTTFFLIDDQNPSGYAQVVEEHLESGGTTNLARVYNFGLALLSQRETTGQMYYFISDGHGSTRMLANQTGVLANTFTYDAFGNLIASNAPPQTAHLYCGEYLDPHTGLIYLRARLDNPKTGRFWTRDTWEGNKRAPLSLHKYLYCLANPANNTDPSGNEVRHAARDLNTKGLETTATLGAGTHQFLILIPDRPGDFQGNTPGGKLLISLGERARLRDVGGKEVIVLGAHNVSGRLNVKLFEDADVMATRELIDPAYSVPWHESDFDAEGHVIEAPPRED
jgi:RHS repeat-associated protein